MIKVAYIKKLPNGKYRVYSESGKNMGTFSSKSEAKNRLKQIEYFKHTKSNIIGERILKLSSAINSTFDKVERNVFYAILKMAGYDDEWKNIIESYAERNPKSFSYMFDGKQKVFIPFNKQNVLDANDKQVIEALQLYDYSVESPQDYVEGYCKDIYGRKLKIGKILDNLISNMQKDLDSLQSFIFNGIKDQRFDKVMNTILKGDETNAEHYLSELPFDIEEIQTLKKIFGNSPARQAGKSKNLQVVISQDPHDIAKMSYERGWKSCMELGSGDFYHCVINEIEDGGMVAYLIREGDEMIKNPLSRLWIRKFVNDNGEVIASPETKVYGEKVEGFLEVVKNFIASKQSVSGGIYQMIGGDYSDTFSRQFGKKRTQAIPYPSISENVVKGAVKSTAHTSLKDAISSVYSKYIYHGFEMFNKNEVDLISISPWVFVNIIKANSKSEIIDILLNDTPNIFDNISGSLARKNTEMAWQLMTGKSLEEFLQLARRNVLIYEVIEVIEPSKDKISQVHADVIADNWRVIFSPSSVLTNLEDFDFSLIPESNRSDIKNAIDNFKRDYPIKTDGMESTLDLLNKLHKQIVMQYEQLFPTISKDMLSKLVLDIHKMLIGRLYADDMVLTLVAAYYATAI